MKKKLFATLSLVLIATLIVGCKSNSKGNSNSDSGSGSEPAGPEWPSDLQTLMQKWCGEVLPYVELKSGYKYEELEDYYTSEPYLGIWDSDSKFTLSNYGNALKAANWTVEVDDSDPSDVYYTASKPSSDGTLFYMVQYYFDSDYGNCIDCWYNQMTTELTANTAWTTSESEYMVSALTEELPFMKFGKGYYIQSEGDELILMDSYYADLSSNYVSVLTSNGYSLGGTYEGVSFYVKTLGDGATITVYPYYSVGSGNYLYALYTANKTTVDTWPSELFASLETASGYIIPSYSAISYEYYIKNGFIYVSSATTTSLKEAYETAGEANGFIKAKDGLLVTWEENAVIYYGDTTDSNNAVTGFGVIVGATTPSSTLVNAWPTAQIEAYMGKSQITVAPVVADDVNTRGFKYYEWDYQDAYQHLIDMFYEEYYWYVEYEIYTEEEFAEYAEEYASKEAPYYVGFYINVYCVDGDAFAAYKAALESTPWYVQAPSQGAYWYAEDGTGDCAAYFADCGYYLEIQILKGKGQAHEPSLELNKTTAKLKKGSSLQLVATKQMIADSVVFESSDSDVATVNSTTGLVTVKADAALNTTVTITATAGTYHAECVITVVDKGSYVLVTSDAQLVDGQYLIVYKSSDTVGYAFNSGLSSLDSTSNYIEVTIDGDSILETDDINDAAWTIENMGSGKYSILSSGGKYIGRTGSSNGITTSTTDALPNEININTGGTASIFGDSGLQLQFNTASGQTRFRYFKSAQGSIYLYCFEG